MKLVLEMTGADDGVAHRVVESFPVTLGRGYHNDIILADPHVGEQHIRIDYDGRDWTVTDLGSVNPLLVNMRPVAGPVRIVSGDELRVGGVRLRAFSPGHPVGPPVPMQRLGPVLSGLMRPVGAWLLLSAAICAAAGWTYIDTWTEEMALALAATAAGAMVCVFVWAALWSVAGRLVRRKSFFMRHVAIASLYILASVALSALDMYVSFLTNEGAASTVFAYAANAALLAALLYGSLSFATVLPRRRRLAAAAFFACGLMAGVAGVNLIAGQKFSPDPPYPAQVEPYLSALAPADTPQEFLDRADRVFGARAFRAAEKDGAAAP